MAVTANAQPPKTTLPASQGTCSLSDVKTFEMVNAVACAGRFNNVNDANSLGAVLSYLNANFADYGPWTHLGQSDPKPGDPSPFVSNVETVTGKLYFDDLMSGYFGVVLKSSTMISIYILDGGAGTAGVNFSTAGISSQDLSHAGLWDGGASSVVPEPSTYLLMAAGLAGLGVAARRRRKA